jgi:hypothetical protein
MAVVLVAERINIHRHKAIDQEEKNQEMGYRKISL